MNDKVNVGCLKWGDKYGPEYVNILHAMVKRNLTIPHNFVCMADDDTDIDPEITTIPIQHDEIEGWWHKLSFFKKDLAGLEGRLLFLDLDVVIVDNIDCFFENDHDFCIIQEWSPHRGFNSSVFLVEIGKYAYVWDDYTEKAIIENKKPHRRGAPPGFSGDQNWITSKIPNGKTWPVEWCPSFKYRCENGLPDGAKIVIFHGRPNPPEAVKGFRKCKAAPWISEHWRI